MDYSELDKVRRTTTPLQLDAVESFARGRLTRRTVAFRDYCTDEFAAEG